MNPYIGAGLDVLSDFIKIAIVVALFVGAVYSIVTWPKGFLITASIIIMVIWYLIKLEERAK